MPIGVCSSCHRRFVVESERSIQRICPYCLHPMEVTRDVRGQLSSALSPDSPHPLPSSRTVVYWNYVPLSADPQGQRLLTALAEAAYQQGLAQAIRQEARKTRGEAAHWREELNERQPEPLAGLPPLEIPADRSVPGRARCSAAVMQARQLADWSLVLQERATEACLRAQILQDRARVVVENRRPSRDAEAALPCVEFVLLADDDLLPDLEAEELERGDVLPSLPEGSWSLAELAEEMGAPGPWQCRPRPAQTTLYVWGYGPPREALCREECRATPAAIRAATEAGWHPDQPNAWAGELALPMGISAALRELEPLLRHDPSIAGWELRMAPSG